MTTTTPNATYPLLGVRKECACALAVPQVWVDLNARALAIDAAKESKA